jgi:putative ABC transport system substrate-binding protein
MHPAQFPHAPNGPRFEDRVRQEPSIQRRTFMALVSGGLLAAPLAAQAQQAEKVYRVGILGSDKLSPTWDAFRNRLRELGYLEGRNIVFEYRWSEGKMDRLPGLAAELTALKVDLIVTSGNAATAALKHATATTPIVMTTSGDPVGVGLIGSLAHPGGNVTGLTMIASRDLAGKQLELLKEVVPKAARIAFLFDPANPGSLLTQKEPEASARTLGVELRFTEVRSENDLEGAFTKIAKERVGALLVYPGFFEILQRRRIAHLAATSRLPAMYGSRQFVDDGGLMSYSVNFSDNFRRAAVYVDKILKGAKPADLPVEQPTKFELIINLKAAKALGLTIQPSLL